MYYSREKEYHLFISHAWSYSSAYETIVEWLDDSDIKYSNYSVPKEDPLHSGNENKLKEDLTKQIRPSSCVIIISGMYAAHSSWIEYEINEAVRMGKYIIGIRPWGAERTPKIVEDNADKMVGWNSASLINAIKEL